MMSREAVVLIAAQRRGLPLHFSWDKACGRGYAYGGYGLDELLRRLLIEESLKHCDQCGAGDCPHEAARLAIFDIRTAETIASLRGPPWWRTLGSYVIETFGFGP